MGDASERTETGLYSLNDFVLHQRILRALHDGVVVDLQDTLGLCYSTVLRLDQATRQLHFFSVPHDSNSSNGGRNNDESATPPLLTIPLDPSATTITCTETQLCIQTSALAGGSSVTEMTLAIRPPHLTGTQDNTECSAAGETMPTISAAAQLQAWLTVLHRLQSVVVDNAAHYVNHSNTTTTTSPRHSYTMRDAQEHGLPSMRDAPLTPTAMLRLLTTYQALLQSMAHFARDELRVVQGVLTQHPQSLTSNTTTAATVNCCDETAHVATHSAEERINNEGEVHAERPATMAHRGLTALPLPLTLTHVTTPGEAPRYSPTHDLTPPPHGEVYAQDDLLTPLATRSSNSMTPAAATTTNNNSRPGSSNAFGGFSHIVHPLLANSLHSSLCHRHRSRVHHSYHSPALRTHSVPDRISSTRSSPAHPQPRPASAWSTHNSAQYPYHQQHYYYPRWSAYSRSTHGSRPNGAQFNNSGSLGHLGPTHGDELALRVYQQIHGKPYRSAANSLSTLTTATTTTTTTTMAAAAAAGADDEVEMGSAAELPEADRVACDENVVATPHTTPQEDMRGSE